MKLDEREFSLIKERIIRDFGIASGMKKGSFLKNS